MIETPESPESPPPEENVIVSKSAPTRPILVGNEFIKFYYSMMGKSIHNMHRFYMKTSTYKHGKLPEAMGQKSIHECIMGINFQNATIRINYVDAQESIEHDILVQTGGTISFENEMERPFTQMFVLAAQAANKFVVLNDVLVYEDDDNGNVVADIEAIHETNKHSCEILQDTQIARSINIASVLPPLEICVDEVSQIDNQSCSNISEGNVETPKSDIVFLQSPIPSTTASLEQTDETDSLTDLAAIEAFLKKDNVDQIWFFDTETSEENFIENGNDETICEKSEEEISIIEEQEPIQIATNADNKNIDTFISEEPKTTNVESKLINVPTIFPDVHQAWKIPMVNLQTMQYVNTNDESGYIAPKSIFHQSSTYLKEYPPVNIRTKIKKTYIPPPSKPNIEEEYGRSSHYYVRTKMSRETILRLIEDQLVNGTHKHSKRYKKFRLGLEAKKLEKSKGQEEYKTTISKSKKRRDYKMTSLLTNLHINNVDFGINSTILLSDDEQHFNGNSLNKSDEIIEQSKDNINHDNYNISDKKNKTNKKRYNKRVNKSNVVNDAVGIKEDNTKSTKNTKQPNDDEPKSFNQSTPNKSMNNSDDSVDASLVQKEIKKSTFKTDADSSPSSISDNNFKNKIANDNKYDTYAARLNNGNEERNKNYGTGQTQPKKSMNKNQKSSGNGVDKLKTGNTNNKKNSRDRPRREFLAYKPNQIFVGRVPTSATKDILISIFSSYGEISEIALFKANNPTVPNYSFITYKNQEDMFNCLSKRPIMLPINANNNHRLNVEVRKQPTFESKTTMPPTKSSSTTKTRVFYNKNFK